MGFCVAPTERKLFEYGKDANFFNLQIAEERNGEKHQLASDHPRQVRPIFVVTRRRAAGSIGVLSCSSKNEEPKLKSRKTK
jgi:hypothetical protein